MIKNRGNYLTSYDAAIFLGFTPDYIRRLIAKGKIKALKLGHNWLINAKDLDKVKRVRFRREKEPIGNEGSGE